MSALELARLDLGVREDKGKNRSKRIDSINRFCSLPMGSPYCAAGVSWCFAHCDGVGIRLPISGSSQFFKRWFDNRGWLTYDPKDLKKMKGFLFGWTNVDDMAHGHIGFGAGRNVHWLTRKVVSIRTVEYNSNLAGSRDGEGVFTNVRLVPFDRSHRLYFMDTSHLVGGTFW